MRRHIIEREGKTSIVINAPTNPALERLWDLALAKVDARGQDIDVEVYSKEVTREYNALTTKPHGPMSQMVRERCDQAPGYD